MTRAPAPAVPGKTAVTALLAVLAFLILASYALARPATESLFLAAYSRTLLPHAWGTLSLLLLAVVAGYNALAARWPLLRLFAVALAVSAALPVVLLGLGNLRGLGRGIPFLMYLWKDIYIVVLVELFWSVANLVSSLRTARWTYWFYCLMGSLGGIAGNLGGGALAGRIGSRAVLTLVVPVLGAAALLLWPLRRRCGVEIEAQRVPPAHQPAQSFGHGLRIVWRSGYLVPLLLMMAVVQVVFTLIDYQFNGAMERAYPQTDARTAVIGQIYAAIDVSAMVLQLLTGPLLRFAGVAAILLVLPLLMGVGALGMVLSARLSVVVFGKMVGKALDYSLLRATKELLYLPLSYEEKTQGKALVDLFGSRGAKGGASLLLLGIAGMSWVPLLTLALCGLWTALQLVILPRYRRSSLADR